MKKENTKEIFKIIVFYSSLWGMAEAVLGYVLHLLPFWVAGFVMFPIGFYFMNRAYRKTQKTSTVFYIGMVAAAIKLIDLFLPFIAVIRIINPAILILFESLMTAAAFKLFVSKDGRLGLKGAVLACMSWRAFYVIHTYILTFFSIPSGLLDSGYINVVKFILFEGFINAVVIYLYIKIEKMEVLPDFTQKPQIRPLVSAGAFAAALAATLVFSII